MSEKHWQRAFGLFMLFLLVALPSAARHKQERKLTVARLVYEELLERRNVRVPGSLLEQARCIAVIPGIVKGALGVGGRHGLGVVSCRNDESDWSPPAFMSVSGGSLGLQVGVESTDLVLFFTTERGARSLLQSEFTLGADLSVAAGPAGASTGVSTDARLKAEIYGYAKSRGLFVGASVEGARVAVHRKSIRRYYGEVISPERILFEQQVPHLGPEAKAFMEALP